MLPAYLSILIFSLLVLNAKSGSNSTLSFNGNHTFKIIQFTDLHFGEGKFTDAKTMI